MNTSVEAFTVSMDALMEGMEAMEAYMQASVEALEAVETSMEVMEDMESSTEVISAGASTKASTKTSMKVTSTKTSKEVTSTKASMEVTSTKPSKEASMEASVKASMKASMNVFLGSNFSSPAACTGPFVAVIFFHETVRENVFYVHESFCQSFRERFHGIKFTCVKTSVKASAKASLIPRKLLLSRMLPWKKKYFCESLGDSD